jgi:transcriptional regulator with XRE-family HTH domain
MTQPPTPAIGEKLKFARQQQQMSLRELAEKADISASMLSQIETGKAFPSVRSIYNIAAALNLPVDYFFPDRNDGADTPETVSNETGEMTASELREAKVNRTIDESSIEYQQHHEASGPVVKAAKRPTIELNGGVAWSRLTAQAEAGAEYLEITYAPGSTSGVNMSHHQGREFGLILEGELTVELGFERYNLCAGDSIIFDSETPHRLTNNCTNSVRALWVVLSGSHA